jgi:hypothetical protein
LKSPLDLASLKSTIPSLPQGFQLAGPPDDWLHLTSNPSAADRHLMIYRFPNVLDYDEKADNRQVGIFSKFKGFVRSFSTDTAGSGIRSYSYGETEFNCIKKNWLGFEEECTLRFEQEHLAMRDFTEFNHFLNYSALKGATLVLGQDQFLSILINQDRHQFLISGELMEKFITLLASKARAPLHIHVHWKGIYNSEPKHPLTKVFGVPLIETIEQDYPVSRGVPSVIQALIREIEHRGLEVEGIFRLPGSHAVIRKLEKDINNGVSCPFEQYHIHDLCTLLKDYFRSLPHPLFPVDWSIEIFELVNIHKNSPDLVRRIRNTFDFLPMHNIPILKCLLQLLVKVNEHSTSNKMDSVNLAKIWSPNLFPNASSIILAHGVAMVTILRIMIEQYQNVFMHRNSLELENTTTEETLAVPLLENVSFSAPPATSSSPSPHRLSHRQSRNVQRRTLELHNPESLP